MEKEKSVRWRWKAGRRRKGEDDPLFYEGNALRNQLTLLLPPSEGEGGEGQPEGSDAGIFVCQISKCRKSFSSVVEYEMHHSLTHRNMCVDCKRHYPNPHLLDLHLVESHDTLFTIRAEKENMYACYVEACGEKFRTRGERKKHSIEVHKYPSNFRFEPSKSTKQKPMQTKPVAMETEKPVAVAMETGSDVTERVSDSGRRFVYNVPKTICFGQGSQRGFQRGASRGRGRKRGGRGERSRDVRDDDMNQTPR